MSKHQPLTHLILIDNSVAALLPQLPVKVDAPLLPRYEALCRNLGEAKRLDEVLAIRDKAKAIRAAAKIAKNRQLEIGAVELRMNAERKLGEFIKAQKETVGLNRGMKGRKFSGAGAEPLKDDRPTLAEAGIDKKLSARAQKLAAIPDEKWEGQELPEWRRQQEHSRIVTPIREPEAILKEAKRIRAKEAEKRRAKIADIIKKASKQNTPLPLDHRYPVIYADPPVDWDGFSTTKTPRLHYPTMTLEEICALPVSEIATPDAILFIWSPNSHLEQCLVEVIKAWGFTYKAHMVWEKDRQGLGHWVRNRHELLLIATRGNMLTPKSAARPPSVLDAPAGRHSEKPKQATT